MYLSLDISVWLTLALSIPAAGFLLRTFIVFHDCAHGSFLPDEAGQPLARPLHRPARLPAVRQLAPQPRRPPRHRRRPRPPRHRRRADADRRRSTPRAPGRSGSATGSSATPLVMFGIGPIWSLMIGPRIWSSKQRPRMRHSVWLTNLALAIVIGAIFWLVGPVAWLLVQMPTAIIAGTMGVWMFYVQHQFEDVYWESTRGLELRRRRPAGQLLPEAAEAAPVLHRQHRPPPRPPPQRQDPQLQPAARPRRERDLPATCRC